MTLGVKILFGLIAGGIAGFFLGPHGAVFKPIGDIFLNLMSMIIVPLVLSSIVIGVTNVCNSKKIGFVAIRTMILFLGMSASAVILGISVSLIFDLGSGLKLSLPPLASLPDTPLLGKMLLELVPQNPVMALVDGNILQIMVFALFLGVAINLSGESGRLLTDIFVSVAEVSYKLTSIVMEFSPIGIFAITAWVSGTFGFSAFYVQMKFLLLYFVACLLFVMVGYCSHLWFGAKVRPWPFFKGMVDPIVFAFSTCSSSSTLPLSMACIQKNIGVSRNIASLVMPLGAALNMNGTAIFQGMGTVFIAHAYGIELGWTSLLILIVTSVFSVIGASGVPGAGFLLLSYVLNVLGVPLEGLALFIGIDRVRDMCSTVMNTLGDAVCAVYIARAEGELDERQYYSERIVLLEGDEV